MPAWKPGIYKRKPINASEFVSVSFYPSEEERLRAEAKKVYNYVEQMPVCGYNYNEYFTKHLKYPDSAKKKYINGRVLVKFIVTETGAIDSVSVLRGIGGGCDEEAMKVVRGMPPWNPGKQNGKPVKVYYNLPVSFTDILSSKEIAAFAKVRKDAIPKRTYDFPEYLRRSLHYPDSARKYNIEGFVVVKFAVSEDGIISDCSIEKSIGYGCDEEALRLVQNMPPWTPGIKDGKETKNYFTQGITFSLGKKRNKKRNTE